jgi:hypothetical protein
MPNLLVTHITKRALDRGSSRAAHRLSHIECPSEADYMGRPWWSCWAMLVRISSHLLQEYSQWRLVKQLRFLFISGTIDTVMVSGGLLCCEMNILGIKRRLAAQHQDRNVTM